jgi:hypothetical protein
LADIVFVLIVLAFFALAAGYVALCDRIIGPDPDVDGDASVTDDDAGTDLDAIASERAVVS